MKLMVIGAHNDECEYGVGGVTALLTAQGWEARFVNPCGGFHKPDATPEEQEEWKRQEQAAAKTLGATKTVFDNRMEPLYRSGHDAVLQIEKEILDFMPDVVFIHHPEDNHIEHRMCAHDSFEALCLAKVHGAKVNEVYSFEAGPNQTGVYFVPQFAINITDAMPLLEQSLLHFDQPCAKGQGLYREKAVASQYRGHVAGFPHAEVFRIVRFPEGNGDLLLKKALNDRFSWWGNGMYPTNGRDYF